MEIHTQRGIIPLVLGGLGNQMFVVAAAFVSSKRTGHPLYIIKNTRENNKHNNNNLDYNQSIFKYFGTHLPLVQNSNEFITWAHRNGYFHNSSFSPPGFHPYYPEQVPAGALMNSYYQYYPPLEPFENELRELFIRGIQTYRESSTIDTEHTAFLHIRRGDYLNHPDIHYSQPIEYYEKCLEMLKERNPNVKTILVFSDDTPWVKSQPFFNQDDFIIFESTNELHTFASMTLCTAGAICANSTFSWWAAYLGSYEKRSPIFVPKRWISDTIVSLFPREWTVV
jgi:hypothetical protein